MNQLTYVFWTRNMYCEAACLSALHARSRRFGPVYTPLDITRPFFCKNIEQQAEMIGDYYLKAYGHAARLERNREVAPSLYEFTSYVPLLAGMPDLTCIPGDP